VKRLGVIVLMAFVVSCSAILGLTDPRIDESIAATDAMPDTRTDAMTSGDALVVGDGGDARTCTDMTTSTDCGRCSHSCLGGECLAGQCQPITLATNQQRPLQLAVSGTTVYWTNNFSDQIMSADKFDGGATVFASGADVSSPWGIVVDATSVYWTNHAFSTPGGIRSCPLAGCPGGKAVTLATTPSAIDVAVDARNIYFTTNSTTAVLQASKLDGGGLLEFPTGNTPFHIAVDPKNMYWTSNSNNVFGMAIDGGAVQTLGPLNGDFPGGITTDSTGIYWGVDFNVGSGNVNKSAANDAGVLKSYGSTNPNPLNIVVDATRIYWTNVGAGSNQGDIMTSDGSVLSCPLEGCDKGERLKTLAAAQHNALGLAQDNDAIYWTTNPPGGGGTIMKVAKP
jgi:hypothetical protein